MDVPYPASIRSRVIGGLARVRPAMVVLFLHSFPHSPLSVSSMTGKRPTRKAASSHDKTSKPVSAKSSAPGVSQRSPGKTTGKMAKTNAAPKKGAAGKLAARKSPVSKPAPAKLGSGGGQPAEGKKSAPSRAKKKVRLLAGGTPRLPRRTETLPSRPTSPRSRGGSRNWPGDSTSSSRRSFPMFRKR